MPSLLSSHLMAETPTWAKGSDSSRFLVETMSCLFFSLILLGLVKGALDLSLYQCRSPVLKRLSHLKNHRSERLSSVYISCHDTKNTLKTERCPESFTARCPETSHLVLSV
jgi:hypothetical protein